MREPEDRGAAATFRADVGLIDIGLPGVDGYEVARRIRATDEGKRLAST